MAFINNHKNATIKSELDIFATPPTQNSIESGSTFCYRPISTLSNTAPIEFLATASGDEYIDLAHTTLHIVAYVKTDAAVAAGAVAQVAPINNWLHSLFSHVDVYLNQKCITPPSNHYGYRSYIENLLNYGDAAKKSHLTSCLWYKDDNGAFSSYENSGYKARKKIATGEKKIELYSNLHCDIFNVNKFMLNGVDLGVKLINAKNEFHLIGDQQAHVEFVEANLFVRKVKINPSILLAHARALSITPAKYPITRVEIKTVTIPADIQSKSFDNLFLGQMPKRCIIGMVDGKAFNGALQLNPFDFQHFNYNYLALYVDSTQIPSRPLTPDFKNNLYTRSYYTLFEGSGIYFNDTGNGISHVEYPNGYCLAAFDLTPDLSCNEPHWNIIKSGTLRAEIRFAEALTSTVNLIIFAEFDNIIEVDKNRNIILDYSS